MPDLFETFDCAAIGFGELFDIDGTKVFGLTSNRLLKLFGGSWYIYVHQGCVVVDHHLLRAGCFGVFRNGLAMAKFDVRTQTFGNF